MRTSLGLILAVLLILSSKVWADNGAAGPSPETDLPPQAVIQILVDALRTNDPKAGDQGIATVWRFAAPNNKASTGPLPRFTAMLKGGFGEMLNHIKSEFGPIEIEDDVAHQAVLLITPTGDEVAYLFRLARQKTGEFEGMWMTEAVFPIASKKPGNAI